MYYDYGKWCLQPGTPSSHFINYGARFNTSPTIVRRGQLVTYRSAIIDESSVNPSAAATDTATATTGVNGPLQTTEDGNLNGQLQFSQEGNMASQLCQTQESQANEKQKYA